MYKYLVRCLSNLPKSTLNSVKKFTETKKIENSVKLVHMVESHSSLPWKIICNKNKPKNKIYKKKID